MTTRAGSPFLPLAPPNCVFGASADAPSALDADLDAQEQLAFLRTQHHGYRRAVHEMRARDVERLQQVSSELEAVQQRLDKARVELAVRQREVRSLTQALREADADNVRLKAQLDAAVVQPPPRGPASPDPASPVWMSVDV